MSRLTELTSKIDGFFARVEARHGDDMQCQTGCSDCCHVRLSVTAVEAADIRTYLATRRIDPNPAPDRCAALDVAGRCQIYDARPVVCRSHGVPIRLREEVIPRSLPVVRNCFRNFTHTEPAADCVLDQETLSTLVLAVDRAAGNDGSRIDLATLLSQFARQ